MIGKPETRTRERIHFRMMQMPCCHHLLCWVNPRLPSHCPECGQQVYSKLRFDGSMIFISDDTAWLEYQTR